MPKYSKVFGERLKALRREKRYTLRAFCREHDFDHGNLSRLERGLAKPPTGERLNTYLLALDVERDSDLWYEMHDLASACAGQLPEELLEEDVIKRLPVIFRTMGRERPSEEQLDKLINLIREEMAGT